MPREKELTTGGSEVLRYDATAGDATVAPGSELVHEAIAAHFDAHVGPAPTVFHELVSEYVHVDVHFVPPDEERPSWVLYTTGMSDRPMTVPPGLDAPPFAELVVVLPAGWRLDEASLRDETWYWPIRLLKFLARFPHVFGTWLGAGHTLPNGDPAEPYAPGCPFSCVLVYPPTVLPEGQRVVRVEGRPDVHLYALFPLHPAETELKLERGTEALLEAFAANGVTERVDIGRPSVAARVARSWRVF